MPLFNPFNIVNRRGVAEVTSSSVSVTADNVVYNFPNHAFYGGYYKGLVLIRLSALPTGTTGTLPVLFSTNGTTQAVVSAGGAPITASDIPGDGVYLFYYDKQTNYLQALNIL